MPQTARHTPGHLATAPRAHTPAKTTPARHTQSSRTIQYAHQAAACKDAAQRERGGLTEAHQPSAAAACDVREGGGGDRPLRCFPLLTSMPPRTPSTAWVKMRSGRPREALTCRGTRTAHVDLAQRGLQARAGAGGKRVEVGRWCVRAFTDTQGGPGPFHSAHPPSLPVPQASCDTARHIRSMCGQMRDAATRRLEAGGSTFKSRRRHPMVVSCATCAVRVPGALGRGGLPACKVRAGQLCSCVHMLQRMTFRAQNV